MFRRETTVTAPSQPRSEESDWRREEKCSVSSSYWVWLIAALFFSLMGFAASGTIIKSLPGYPGTLPFNLETGYVSVRESGEVELFYYFTESVRDPSKDPLILWISGGPGCSGFSTLVYETGPLIFNYTATSGSLPSFQLNPYSWTKFASIIFLDAPVGTGFSYGTTSEALRCSDTSHVSDTHNFLRKWLLDHPKFIQNPLYIAGESYGGTPVSMLAVQILQGNEAGMVPHISLQGYMLGNPVADFHKDVNSRILYAYKMGLVSDEYYEPAKRYCFGEYVSPNPNNALCLDYLNLIQECISKLNYAHILEPRCDSEYPRQDGVSGIIKLPYQTDQPWCRSQNYMLSNIWANDPGVREALHVRNGTKGEWSRCTSNLSFAGNVFNVVENHRLLNKKGCRALIFSGDHDLNLPYISTLAWIRYLKIGVEYLWRPWFVDDQIAGFTEKFNNNGTGLTFATVKGGGHNAPEYKPKECFSMASRWLSDSSL